MDPVNMSATVATIITLGVIATPLGTAYNGWAQRRESRRQAAVLAAAAELVAAKAELVAAKVEEARKFNEAVAEAVAEAQAKTDLKLNAIVESNSTIHNLVDGNMSEAKATIKELKATIEGLERLLGRVVPLPPATGD